MLTTITSSTILKKKHLLYPKDAIRIASFDIGRENFASYVEDASIKGLLRLRGVYDALPKKEQRRCKGKFTTANQLFMDDMYTNSTRVHMGVFDLRSTDEVNTPLDMDTRKNLCNHLEAYRDLWKTCDIIIVEQQYFNTFTKNKGGGANINAIKFGEDALMWFLINFPEKHIDSFSSSFKTQILGAPDKLTKPKRKSWSVENAMYIEELRGDDEGWYLIAGPEKRRKGVHKIKMDDVSDALNQCQAFKYKCLIANF